MPDELKVPSGPCLEPEVLAAYVERTLTPDERVRAEAHLAECGGCYTLLTEVMRTIDDMDGRVDSQPQAGGVPIVAESPKVLRPAFGRRRIWTVAGGLLAAAAALVLVVRVGPQWLVRSNSQEPRFASLIEAVGNERTIDGRLTGGFDYAPLRRLTRAQGALPDNLSLLAAAGEAQKAAQADPSAGNLRIWGLAQLLLGQYDGAVRDLESAVALQPHTADLQSDLAAAYTARWIALDRADDALNAVGAARRALDLSPSHPEAAFNLALALELLNLDTQAVEAWRRYLEIDSTSGWATEARSRVENLQRKSPGASDIRGELNGVLASFDSPRGVALVDSHRQEVREWIEEVGLLAWSQAVETGRWRIAREQFAVLERLAAELSRAEHDGLLLDHLAHIRQLSGASLYVAAAAHGAFAGARAAHNGDRVDGARAGYDRARAGFERVAAPYRLWADVYLSHTDQHRGDHATAVTRARRVRMLAPRDKYPILYARTLWSEALALGVAERFADVFRRAEEAEALFEAAGERIAHARMTLQASSALSMLGDSLGGWSRRLRAVSEAQVLGNARLSHVIYNDAAIFAALEGFPEAANYFTEEMERTANTWSTPAVQLETIARRANQLLAEGRHGEAGDAIARASTILDLLSADPRFPFWKLEVETLRLSLPEARVSALTRLPANLALAEEHKTPHVIPLLLELATHRSDGQGRAAVNRAIELLGNHRPHDSVPWLRPIWAARAWASAVTVAVSTAEGGNAPAAIDLLERFRSRPNAARGSPRSDPTAGRSPLLYYAQADNRLWCFVTANGKQRVYEVPLAPAAIAGLVRSISNRSSTTAAHAGRQLFDALLTPAIDIIAAGSGISIVPDGVARLVPFSALVGPDGRYAVEHFQIAFSTTAGGAAASSGWRNTGKSVFVALNRPPSDDPPVTPLPGARREVTESATLYPQATLLLDANATRTAVLSAFRDASLIHIATHATVNLFAPQRSALLLGGDLGAETQLSAEDLTRIKLRHDAVVLLAGCSTAYGRQRQGEQHQSLIDAFVRAGAEAVLGSIWPLDDADTPDLMRDVHRALRAGQPLPAAVRGAQLASIRRNQSPAAWGGLVAFTNVRDVSTEGGAN